MKQEKVNLFDRILFRKIMSFSRPYQGYYQLVLIAAVLLSAFSTLTPYLLKVAVDDYITLDCMKVCDLHTYYAGDLLLEVIFQYIFVYFANWLGQMIVKDLRAILFNRLIHFKMAYFDTSAVGRLVTRAVNDIETIAVSLVKGCL